ncbi:unnamed protein product [Polarella glacialis]|uniref:Uncharacterized protein n=1 Tax=Polarella glacialis TaxID=89957 RepID=A0A813KIP3_POLGL|nr:unnamed protein product [Polarella glacialis]
MRAAALRGLLHYEGCCVARAAALRGLLHYEGCCATRAAAPRGLLPCSPTLMELVLQAHVFQTPIALRHVQRDFNKGADALTNLEFKHFAPQKNMVLVISHNSWFLLPKLMLLERVRAPELYSSPIFLSSTINVSQAFLRFRIRYTTPLGVCEPAWSLNRAGFSAAARQAPTLLFK